MYAEPVVLLDHVIRCTALGECVRTTVIVDSKVRQHD